MSITNRIIEDICRSKFGNAVDSAVRNLDLRDVEDMIETISWGKAEDMFNENRRYQDIDHAYQELSRSQNEYAQVVGFSAMVIIGMGLDIIDWYRAEFSNELPRQLLTDADSAYRSILREVEISSNEAAGSVTSGYRSGKEEHSNANTRINSVNSSAKYAKRAKGSFTTRAKEAPAPRYTGVSGGFAERMRGDQREYEVVDTPETETVEVFINKIYPKRLTLSAFNVKTGEVMESYEEHEIVPTKQRHVGINLRVSKLVTLSSSSNAKLVLAPGENSVISKEDVHPAELLTLPLHKAIDGKVSSALSTTECSFTMSTADVNGLYGAFNNSTVYTTLNAMDTYKRLMESGSSSYELLSYVTSILARYVSQGITLALGDVLTITPNQDKGWKLSVSDLELNFDTIEDGIRQLMAAKDYSWAAESIEELFENGFMRNRLRLSIADKGIDDTPDTSRLVVRQDRVVINAPGHLDTNVSHIDTGDMVEVAAKENPVFATALRCIEDSLYERGLKVGSIVLIDDYGYAIEFLTGFSGSKLFVQRHLSY